MRRFLLTLILLPGLLYADQVVLTNGDTITGSIIKKDDNKLTLKSEFLGEVTVPWSAVKSLRSDEELAVVMPGGETVKGKVDTRDNQLEVTVNGQTRNTPLAGVAAVRNASEQRAYEHPGLLELWAGTVDLGLALTRGNAHTDTLNTNFAASRVTSGSKTTLHFNQIYGTARLNGVTADTANAVRGGWSFSKNLSPRLFATVLNEYEHDQFQDLDLRFVIGGGLGYTAIKTDRIRLDLVAGLDYDRETFTSGLHRNFAEVNFGDEFLYKVSGVTTITQSARIFPNLSSGGDYRANFDLTAVTTLKKWLGWQVTASDRFMTNPVFGRQRNDLLLSTGFRVSFAR